MMVNNSTNINKTSKSSQLNTKKEHNIWCGKSCSWFGTGTKMGWD
jgi:hypothetical protein